MKNSTYKQKHTATRQDHHAPHHRLTQKHTADQVDHHAPHHRSVGCVAILQRLFFLFIYRLQAQARTGPGSLPRGSRKDLFFLFINRLQAQANATQEAADPVRFFLYIL
jgi:hypothetical protein